MTTIWKLLTDRRLPSRVVFDTGLQQLLDNLALTEELAAGDDPDDIRKSCQIVADKSPLPLPVLSLHLKPPIGPFDFHLAFDGGAAADGFKLWLQFDTLAGAAIPGASSVLSLIAAAPGHLLQAATYQTDAADGREWLEAVMPTTPATIEGLRISLRVAGKAGEAASMTLSPTDGGPEGLVNLRLNPPTVLIGNSGFGLQLPDTAPDGTPVAIVIDDSSEAVPPGTTMVDGAVVATPADDPAWRGIAIRHLRFFLPEKTPFFGGHAVDAHLEIGIDPPGIDLVIDTKVPPTDSRPGLDVHIECRDPTARGLAGFAPTLVEVAMTLPLDGRSEQIDGDHGLQFMAGKPVVARARFSRLPQDDSSTLALALESQGDEGIVSIHAPGGGPGAQVLIAAAALATAIVADKPPAGADASGVVLHALLVAALGASAFLQNKGKVVVHAVELQSTGHGLPVGDEVRLLIDYSVDVVVRPLDIGVLKVELSDAQPMRVRNRHVGLSFLPNNSGLDMFKLDFSQADMEIEDPGSWMVNGPASLFDILGTRSGRGSTWLEVDLRFKLNLGPVQISGATIRGTLDVDSGDFSVALEGLDASLNVPAVLDGEGKLQLLDGGGFAADLRVAVLPLNLSAEATVKYQPQGDSFLLYLRLAVDLPGPLPIGSTGFGLYGLAGSVGINAMPVLPPGDQDLITRQLKWDSGDPNAFGFAADQLTIGAEAVLGSVADMGFSFSIKGGVFVTVPDVAVRASMFGQLMSPRLLVTAPAPGDDAIGLSFKGVAVVDPHEGVTVGLKGQLNVPVLMQAVVPLGAHFPVTDPSNWYVYLGADGWTGDDEDRGMGPMRVTVLPDLFPQHADAYLMLRGKGIHHWPRGEAPDLSIADGFIIAFGFAVEMSIGPRPVAWAEVHGGIDIIIATSPLTLAGFGFIGGSLHLGPFSIGVDAQLAFIVPESGPSWVKARVCGHIDLFFTEIEGCAKISVGDKPTRSLPPPAVHPLDAVEGEAIVGDLVYLIDGSYQRLAAMTRTPAGMPMVWPDTLIHLAFGVTPKVNAGVSGGQFDDASLKLQAAQPVGSEMLRYEWTLTSLQLFDVTGDENGAGTPVAPLNQFSAAWQKGKDGALGIRPQAGELVLLDYDSALWLQRLADGGASLPPSPLDDPASICQALVAAERGWAVGSGATSAPPAMKLPSATIDPNPCVSRFTALVTSTCGALPGQPLGIGLAARLPTPFWFTALGIAAAQPALKLDRPFDGWLQLGFASLPGGDVFHPQLQLPRNLADVVPSEPLLSARLWIAIAEKDVMPEVVSAQVWSAGGGWTLMETTPPLNGLVCLRYEPPFAGSIASVTIAWRLNMPLALIGLGGITQAALDAAAAYNQYLQNEAKKLADAAAKQPQQADDSQSKDVHCLLAPGKTYRLDVDLHWQGWLYEQDEAGNRQEVKQPVPDPGTDPSGEYTPKGSAEPVSTKRSYFFRTTPAPIAPAPGVPRIASTPAYGNAARLVFLQRAQNVFEPEMLQRHLIGYTPAQSETVRFADDSVSAHFDADHVTALAKAYGYDLKLGLRRVDVPDRPDLPGNLGALASLTPVWVALEAPELLPKVAQLRHAAALAGPCAVPKPGATLKATLPLATLAWHEVYVQATQKEGAADVERGRLPGVTFRTSRWRHPSDMLAGLGFPPGGGTHVAGDIALAALPALVPAVVVDSDAGYEDALATLGLEGWPAAQAPRVSQFWLPGDVDGAPGWLCAGVMIESPEPIHRPGRVTIGSLLPSMRFDKSPAANFDLQRRDRSGSRLLYLTSTPFVPRGWSLLPGLPLNDPMLVLTLQDAASGATLQGVMQLNRQPAFAEEV